ncbi:histone-lysine N-methyltransferase ATX3-like, partial [Trifolium medium]|nr:histone-lysine N-methyltransferase ATX3-like [Trifolium medium]
YCNDIVIKRVVKTEMPKLKRCKLEEPDSKGDADDFSNGPASWSSEVSHCDGGGGGGEVEFNSNSVLLNGKTVKELGSVVARPPLL